jgi:hypothetical protein
MKRMSSSIKSVNWNVEYGALDTMISSRLESPLARPLPERALVVFGGIKCM